MLSYLFTDEHTAVPPVALPESRSDSLELSRLLSGKRAIIVEDEGITQLQIARILRSEGVQVVGTAGNGKEAIAIVLRERPDFVLMDIKMPVMDGLEASEHILATYMVCIVMLTAFSDAEYQKRAQDLGACGYVIKPITSETLIPELKAAYHRCHHRDPE